MWRMCPIECDKVPHTGLILPWQKLLRYGIKDTPKQLNHSTKIKVFASLKKMRLPLILKKLVIRLQKHSTCTQSEQLFLVLFVPFMCN